jgi:hypothetical protein
MRHDWSATYFLVSVLVGSAVPALSRGVLLHGVFHLSPRNVPKVVRRSGHRGAPVAVLPIAGIVALLPISTIPVVAHRGPA